MIFLPIVDRELRVAARRRSTYWNRAAIALACVALGIFLYFDAWARTPQILGKRIFTALAWVALVYCLLAGRRSTADSLSEEKREGTLGLLFLTDLKGYDVVLGKVAATSLNAFYGLLAILPILAIPLLLGGVSNGEFWRMVLVLIDTFLFSLSIGITVSALNHEAHKALGFNLIALLCLIGLPPAIAGAIAYFSPAHPFVAPLFFSCPIYTFYLSGDTFFRSHQGEFWLSVIVVHVLTWSLLWLASAIVPRTWQERVIARPGAGQKSLRERWQEWTYGTLSQRAQLRRRLLQKGAYYWLAARGRFQHVRVWLFLAVVVCWWGWAWIKSDNAWSGEVLNPINVMTAIASNAILKLWLAIEAGRQIADDKKSGAFELLLSTPLGPREILRGQLRALLRQFLGPLLLVTAGELLFMVHDLQIAPRAAYVDSENWKKAGWFWCAGILILLADMVALGWVSMYTALRSRSANQATIGALIRVLVLPWIVVWLAGGMAALSRAWFGGSDPEWPFYLGWWFAAGIFADLLFGRIAWLELRLSFRHFATLPVAHSGWRWQRFSRRH